MTIIDTATAIPAFLRMKNDRGLTFLGIGDINIYLTGFDTLITTIAFLRVKNDRVIGSWNIRQGIHFMDHIFLLKLILY
jgi:hypothetical protein